MHFVPRFSPLAWRFFMLSALAVVLVACTSGTIFRRELAFTREDLQSRLTRKFPRQEKHQLMAVTFSNPEVVLEPGADTMGIRLDLNMTPRLGKRRRGWVLAQGGIEYRPERGEFFIVNPRVRELEIDDLKKKYQQVVRSIADRIVEEYLSEVPVYRLNQKEFKQKVAKLVLKSVEIKDGRLVVVVGL